uniref:Sorting nexin 19 n=1 Tax=Astyanax mexicanus TaxID=7994 RepID=W5K3C8_ASTMX
MSQPEHLAASPSGVAEFMVQKKLLGFGALLAWMILFHLLVNVWLLCVFTSLLVVIGGWLGSQAVLDSESVLHLERFVSLEKIQSDEESELELDHEIQNTVSKIIRDFVSSWYNTVSSEPEFEEEVHNAMISMAMELKRRAKKVDRKALTMRTLDLCGCHLQCYLRAKEIRAENEGKEESGGADESLWREYSTACTPYPALQSPAIEVNYARAIVDLLLHVLVPPPHLETRTGRFVVCELITCKVLLPLIAKLSDPDWLNMLIIEIFTNSNKPQPRPVKRESVKRESPSPTPVVSNQDDSQQDQEVPPSLPLKVKPNLPSVADTPELASYDVIDSAELYCPQNVEDEETRQVESFPSANYLRDYPRLAKSNPFFQETDSDLESPLNDYKRSSLESLVLIGTEEAISERLVECHTPVDGVLDLEEEFRVYPNAAERTYPKVVVSEVQDQPSSATEGAEELPSSLCALQEPENSDTKMDTELMEADQSGALNPCELPLTDSLQATSPSAGAMPLSPFAFEPLSSPEGPVVIQNLRITGTITAKEHRGTGSHPYTLYTVKYETAMDSENPGTLQPVAYHTVSRRYSEFLNLQTRLEEKPELRKILKHVKGPKKIFPDLPFGNMDSDKVEARKSLLETFLKQLCAIPETANSEEMQEFLALNTDARIAFVKKPCIVSRIDKMVVNVIVDTLKTAFPRSEPQSPTDEVDTEPDGKLFCDKKSKAKMRFASKVTPALNVSDMRPKVVYCFGEGSTLLNSLAVNGVESNILERENLLNKTQSRDGDGEREVSLSGKGDVEPCACAKLKLQNSVAQDEGETVLADMALNVLCLLMKEQWRWLCTENIQRSIRLLFGTLIDRWLEVGVANLTCTQYWVTYLQVLQDAVWPGGCLPTQPRPQRSQQQRDGTKQQCLQCLMKLVPDLLSDMLGSEKYKLSWQTVLDSIQDPIINRHLVYCVWELLIEFLIPEASDEDFQKTLLHSLSKNAEKLPP